MTVEEIKKKIKSDKDHKRGSYCRYPIRFVFMDASKNTADELADVVSSFDGDFISLNDSLMSDDGWITKTTLMSIVKGCSKIRDSFIVGFSELVRFYSGRELESLLLSLVGDIENDLSNETQKRRIYFICFSMKEYLQQIICDKFRRLDVYNPFINPEFEYSGSNKELLFVNNTLNVTSTRNVIRNSREWLSLWKNAAIFDYSKPILCLSENLYAWYQKVSPDNAFHIEVVRDYKQLIEKMCMTVVPFSYQEYDAAKWHSLYDLFSRKAIGVSIDDLATEICNVKTLDYLSSFVGWYTAEEKFKKWFMAEYIKTRYADSLAADLLNNHLFNKDVDIIKEMLSYPYKNETINFCEERIKLISAIRRYLAIDDYEEHMYKALNYSIRQAFGYNSVEAIPFDIDAVRSEQITDEQLINRVCAYIKGVFLPAYTGLFSAEKEYLIKFVATSVVSAHDVEEIYHALFDYVINENVNIDDFLDEYFCEYRKSKLIGCDTEGLINKIKEFNESEQSFYSWYYKYKTQSEMIKHYQNDAIYIIDGLGGEYMPVVISLLSKYGYKVETVDYAVSHLPSITSINRSYITIDCHVTEWFDEFDRKAIHGEFYRTTKNLRKAFDILDNVIAKIVSNQDGAPFILTADHGATARGKWCNTSKKYNYDKADHEGRCLRLTGESQSSTEDYLYYLDSELDASCYVALREVSLYNCPRYEDHGGATPEEIVVPFIRAVEQDLDDNIEYFVELLSNKVTGLDKRIRFFITPRPNGGYVIDGDGVRHNLEDEGGKWVTELSSGRTQKVKIYVGDRNYIFDIVNASASNMTGKDDGFDDFD